MRQQCGTKEEKRYNAQPNLILLQHNWKYNTGNFRDTITQINIIPTLHILQFKEIIRLKTELDFKIFMLNKTVTLY